MGGEVTLIVPRMMFFRYSILGAYALLLTACATTPLQPLPTTHPANPAAMEASFSPRSHLGSDEETAKTRELLKKSDAGQPESDSMSNMQGMQH